MKKKISKISKKIFLLILSISIFICGCTSIDIKMVNSTNEITEKISFNGLDDINLHNYIIETMHSGIYSEFETEDYEINNITVVYVSKEYIEEVDYNSQSNIYFGYTLEDLKNEFNGKKYVFDVDDNNQTTVVEFQEYENVYGKMLKNVVIGSGVILVCVTFNHISTGTAIAAIFAASAKTGTDFAISSAILSGVASSVELFQDGDLTNVFEKGMLSASEGFKWGAIIGTTTGGFIETISQVSAAKKFVTMNSVEKGASAEARALKKYGGETQTSYLNGVRQASSPKGSTRPDLLRKVNGKLEAIEIKNYDLNNTSVRNNLVKHLKMQISNRVYNMPKDSLQRIVLDIHGRNYDKNMIKSLIKRIQDACHDVYPNIPVDIMP